VEILPDSTPRSDDAGLDSSKDVGANIRVNACQRGCLQEVLDSNASWPLTVPVAELAHALTLTCSFQSQTSCVVLLHEVAQKQLHNFPRLAWEEDLAQASVCLEALAFCGTADPVALSFHAALEPVYARLASFSSRIKSEDLDTPPTPPTNYLLTIPQDADPALASLSLTLLQALCRPFGDDERNLGAVSGDVNARSASGSATGMEQDNPLCRMDERLDWAWKDTVPVQWDHDDLGIGTAAPLPANRCFLGSVEPSGWAAGRGDL
jgi:hypothetical protein